jgi:2-phospho-L-lactate guanylyltransferase
VVVPVKRLATAKSRLRGALPEDRHDDLVLAMALDTLAAARSSPLVRFVLVVTDDPRAAAAVAAAGTTAVPDLPDAGLNPALAYGAARVREAAPEAGVAVLGSDLPALRAEELTAALRAAERSPRAFVPDLAGSGTTLLVAAPGTVLDPAYGPASAAAHAASGALRLDGDWPSLRRDVDTAADLTVAARLGLGPRTAALLRTVTAR